MKTTIGARGLPWAAAALLAGGCALQPRHETPAVEAPHAWATLPAAAGDSRWRAPSDAALEALQQRALAANRDIAQALLRRQAAERQHDLAGLARQPTPSLGGGPDARRALQGGATLQRSAALNASASVEADLWQRLAHVERAAGAQARAAEADWAAARVLVRARVAEAYWTLAALAAQKPSLALQTEGAEQALALTRLRVQEGKLLPIEIDKAAATLQALRLQAAQHAEEGTSRRLQLALLLAEPAFAAPPAAALPGVAPADWRAAETPQQVLERRPDVQQARAELDAALERLHGAEAARYPRLAFNVGVGSGSGSASWSDWLQNPLATLSGSLLVPMVDWRRLDLQRRDALDERELAALHLRDTMQRALVEIERLAAEQARLNEEHAAHAQRLREAHVGERLAALRLEAGAIGRLDWLQARSARLAAEQDGTRLALRRILNAVALERAVAGRDAD